MGKLTFLREVLEPGLDSTPEFASSPRNQDASTKILNSLGNSLVEMALKRVKTLVKQMTFSNISGETN